MLALAGIVAFSADAEMIRRRPIQQYTLLTLRWTFPARRASGDSICSAERAAMRARVIFISKHQCRLGGDCADLFWPPRADDHRVTSNRSSEGNAHWRKVGDGAQTNRLDAAKLLKPLALPRGLEPLFSP
jgi:hypothetical protein